jgi:hypothetical protein
MVCTCGGAERVVANHGSYTLNLLCNPAHSFHSPLCDHPYDLPCVDAFAFSVAPYLRSHRVLFVDHHSVTDSPRCFFQPSSAIAARPARPHWQHQESKTQTSGPKEGTMLDTHPPCKCHMYAMQYTAWRNAYMLHKCNLQTAVRDTHEKYATSSNALPSKTDRKPNPCMTRNRKDRNTR